MLFKSKLFVSVVNFMMIFEILIMHLKVSLHQISQMYPMVLYKFQNKDYVLHPQITRLIVLNIHYLSHNKSGTQKHVFFYMYKMYLCLNVNLIGSIH